MNFKFKEGDEVIVACRDEYNWCKIGDHHTIRIPLVREDENVYVVDDHDRNVYIPECNLEFVNAHIIVPRETIDPIKMRDTIIELEAYEEHFRRERDVLITGLVAEGFVLINQIGANLDKIDKAVSAHNPQDPKGWVEGDSLKCLLSAAHHCYSVGKVYKVVKAQDDFDLCLSDNYGSSSYCGFNFYEFDKEDYVFTKVDI